MNLKKLIHERRLPYFKKIIKQRIFKNGAFEYEHQMPMCSLKPYKIIKKVIELYHPIEVLDVGCGTGESMLYFYQNGVSVTGIEGSKLAKEKSRIPDKIILLNLNNEINFNERYDLIWCFEVAEHIHPKFLDNFMKTLSNHSNRIVISCARKGQGGDGHFNEQNDEYWISKFKEYGYKLNRKSTYKLRNVKEHFAKNMYVFEKIR